MRIFYNISAKNKRYEANFIQIPEKIDSVACFQKVFDELSKKYDTETLKNPNDETQKEMVEVFYRILAEDLSKRSVWFRIDDSSYGEYIIVLFYDNKFNESDGEDL